MKLDLGFDLPFAVQMSCGNQSAPLRVVVSAASMSTTQMEQIEAHVVLWGAAAAYGMAAGAQTAPRMYAGPLAPEALLSITRAAHGSTLTFNGGGVVCDPRYGLILLHKLFCLATLFDPIASVTVELPVEGQPASQVSLVRAPLSSLPELFPVPFAHTIDLTSGAQGREIEIEFTRPLSTKDSEVLDGLLATWLAQAAQGGYVSPSFPPDAFSIFPAAEPEFDDAQVRWTLSDLSLDPRVVYPLLHGLVAFSQAHVPIREFVIS